MIIKTIKQIQLSDMELIELRKARDILVELNDEVPDDDIDELVCGLEHIIYHGTWEIEEGE